MGDAGDGTCFETLPNGKKEFTLAARKWVEHKGVRFYNGERAVVVKRWLERVDEDASGLTFEEWDPSKDADPNQAPSGGYDHQLERAARRWLQAEEAAAPGA